MTRTNESVATKDSWENLQPMPERCVELRLDITLSPFQAKRVRQGFIPAAMEDKWFAYFDGGILYQHRSWTGFCIDKIYFDETPNGGLHATRAVVNRNASQYSNTDDEEDRCRIDRMVSELANQPPGAISLTTDTMMTAIQKAKEPNYLGSPEVMNRVVFPFYESCIQEWIVNSYPIKFADCVPVELARRQLIDILRGRNSEYSLIGTWHTTNELGKSAIKYFCLNEYSCEGESLGFILVESLAAIQHKINDLLEERMLEAYEDDVEAPEPDSLVELLAPIREFVVATFMGTNSVLMPDVTLNSISWGYDDSGSLLD